MSHFNISLFSTKHTSAVMDTFFFKCMWVVCLFVFTVKKKKQPLKREPLKREERWQDSSVGKGAYHLMMQA